MLQCLACPEVRAGAIEKQPQMSRQAIDDTIVSIQQILDRDYANLEWRVLSSQPASSELPDEPFVYVHARTCDFRHRCRIARP